MGKDFSSRMIRRFDPDSGALMHDMHATSPSARKTKKPGRGIRPHVPPPGTFGRSPGPMCGTGSRGMSGCVGNSTDREPASDPAETEVRSSLRESKSTGPRELTVRTPPGSIRQPPRPGACVGRRSGLARSRGPFRSPFTLLSGTIRLERAQPSQRFFEGRFHAERRCGKFRAEGREQSSAHVGPSTWTGLIRPSTPHPNPPPQGGRGPKTPSPLVGEGRGGG